MENEQFLKAYLELFISRFIHSSLSLNPTFGDIDDAKNMFRLYDQQVALRNCFAIVLNEKRNLTEEEIIRIADMVNKNSMYISNGYRKIGSYFADTNKPIAKPESIHPEMQKLIETYETDWKDMPVLEKVTKFHLRFFQIHPFEDGNGRVARMILCTQLLKEGYFPFIITQDKFREYHEALYYDNEEAIFKIFTSLYQNEEKYAQALLEQVEVEKGKAL